MYNKKSFDLWRLNLLTWVQDFADANIQGLNLCFAWYFNILSQHISMAALTHVSLKLTYVVTYRFTLKHFYMWTCP